jgi:hypothetical protein
MIDKILKKVWMLTMMCPISMQNLNMFFLYFYLEAHLKNHIYLEAEFFFKMLAGILFISRFQWRGCYCCD